MKKRILLGVVIGIVVLAGGAAAFVSWANDHARGSRIYDVGKNHATRIAYATLRGEDPSQHFLEGYRTTITRNDDDVVVLMELEYGTRFDPEMVVVVMTVEGRSELYYGRNYHRPH